MFQYPVITQFSENLYGFRKEIILIYKNKLITKLKGKFVNIFRVTCFHLSRLIIIISDKCILWIILTLVFACFPTINSYFKRIHLILMHPIAYLEFLYLFDLTKSTNERTVWLACWIMRSNNEKRIIQNFNRA